VNEREEGGVHFFAQTKAGTHTKSHTGVTIHDSVLAEPANEREEGRVHFFAQTKAGTHAKSHAGV